MAKPIWVFEAGTYRSASTTQYMMARDIVEMTGNGIGIGYHQESKLKKFDVPSKHRYVVCKVFEYLPGGFKGHKDSVGKSHGQTIYREHRLKVLVTIRDPRDIICSMRERHKRQMEDPKHQRQPFDFEHRVKVEFPVWLGQLDRWIGLGPGVCMVSRYEVFTHNLLEETRRIAEFLDIDITREQARDISGRHTLKSIVDFKKSQRKKGEREDPWLPNIPGPLFGKSGVYEDYLSPLEEQMVVGVNKEWMKKYGYLP